MLKGSQPLDPKFCEKYGLGDSDEHLQFSIFQLQPELNYSIILLQILIAEGGKTHV